MISYIKRIKKEAEREPLYPLFVLGFFMAVGMTISSFLVAGWFQIKNSSLSLEEISKQLENGSLFEDVGLLRGLLFVQHLFLFIVPGFLVFQYIQISGKNKVNNSLWAEHHFPNWRNLRIVFLIMITTLIPVVFFAWINQKVWLPEWAKSMENQAGNLTKSLFSDKSAVGILFNALLIGLVPAIGEELVFRGVAQTVFQNYFKKPMYAIIVSALIFSLFHLQFEGFLPRFGLGIVLGYIFFIGKSIWYPIWAHMSYNLMNLVFAYRIKATEIPDEIQLSQVGFLAIFTAISILLMRYLFQEFKVSIENLGKGEGISTFASK
jgi:uncharacterized protein